VAGIWILLIMTQVKVMNYAASQEEAAPFSSGK